ncbi:hypothetical protein FRC12_016949 [Ceratobasidium sp. 428]|nr:hypothetical protein FRC12_016949 [Ceratobasidium sp. 428]
MTTPLISVKDLAIYKGKDDPIFSNISFEVREGDVAVLQGRSGGGKTTLLKSLAHLNVYEGEVLFRGQPPSKYTVPTYRTRVLYVPQRASLLPANPRHFLATVNDFNSRKDNKDKATHATYGTVAPQHFVDDSGVQLGADPHDPFALAKEWGLEEAVWDRDWAALSGGEAQRVLLAIAAGLRGTEVLLLDEPTSALDSETSLQVEKTLTSLPGSSSTIKAIVWITHSHEQAERVGTRWLNLIPGSGLEEGDSSAHHQQNGSV